MQYFNLRRKTTEKYKEMVKNGFLVIISYFFTIIINDKFLRIRASNVYLLNFNSFLVEGGEEEWEHLNFLTFPSSYLITNLAKCIE